MVGEEVFLQVEHISTMENELARNWNGWNEVYLNNDNHVTLIPAEHKCKYCGATTSQPDEVCWNAPGPLNKGKDETWDDVLNGYESSEYRNAPLINYLRSNYNTPTRIK